MKLGTLNLCANVIIHHQHLYVSSLTSALGKRIDWLVSGSNIFTIARPSDVV
jgi:hypothetical protein